MNPYAALLDRLAAVVLLGCAVWGLLVVASLLLELRTAGRVPALRWVGLSPTLRRTVLGALGLVVVTGAAGPAGALPLTRTPHPSLAPLPVPSRLVGAWPPGRDASEPIVVVRRGDTLWHLAEAHLRPHASDADVGRAVRHWHAANRPVIGPDPDLIRPGQRLRIPHEERP